MSLMTLATTITGGNDPAYYAGRADAYDEHTAGATVDELTTRAGHITDLHDPMYAAGYTARVLEIRRETATRTATEADIAHHLLARAA